MRPGQEAASWSGPPSGRRTQGIGRRHRTAPPLAEWAGVLSCRRGRQGSFVWRILVRRSVAATALPGASLWRTTRTSHDQSRSWGCHHMDARGRAHCCYDD